jgi:hypothetical protein
MGSRNGGLMGSFIEMMDRLLSGLMGLTTGTGMVIYTETMVQL